MTEQEKKEYQMVILAGLLHDVGALSFSRAKSHFKEAL